MSLVLNIEFLFAAESWEKVLLLFIASFFIEDYFIFLYKTDLESRAFFS
jgi:hypothetical protein